MYVLATDLSSGDESARGWIISNQNIGENIEKLWDKDICKHEEFNKYCTFKNVDMNNIPKDIGTYDFCWSCCAIEHVGSLQRSKEFLKNMINVLKPGGVAVHTTEFNLSSNDSTIEEGGSVIFRKKDIEEIKEWMVAHGCEMETSYCRSELEGDSLIDIPPYNMRRGRNGNYYHLLLEIGEFIATSFCIVIRKIK